jgi:putative transposase/transposase-like zinc-binding protein
MPQPTCHSTTGARPHTCELADIVRLYGPAYRRLHRLPLSHLKVLRAIEACRTAALGGHRESCAQCGFERFAYNSCRNRHCPKCQALVKARWLEQRQAELLPVPYFHNVFTLPHQLNPLILCQEQNQRAILNLLFQAVAETLLTFGRNNLGGTPGITMVLHTWDQQLRAHFHVHCLVTGGALASDGQRWRPARDNFLFPVRALSRVFRAKFLDGLRNLYEHQRLVFPATLSAVAPLAKPETFRALLAQLRRMPWVVYSKPPFAGPKKLLDYLGRYTHRVALSNSRLLSCEQGQVAFHYRDRADGDRRKVACLPASEFLHRFLWHVLPKGFMRIRHYGLLANRHKHDLLARSRQLLGASEPEAPTEKTTAEWLLLLLGLDISRCPRCGHAPLQRTELQPLWQQLLAASRCPMAPPIREDSS